MAVGTSDLSLAEELYNDAAMLVNQYKDGSAGLKAGARYAAIVSTELSSAGISSSYCSRWNNISDTIKRIDIALTNSVQDIFDAIKAYRDTAAEAEARANAAADELDGTLDEINQSLGGGAIPEGYFEGANASID